MTTAMKRVIALYVLMSAASMMIFQSCNKNQETGTISFGLDNFIEDGQLKSAATEIGASEALVSIVNASGELVFDKEPLPLYRFGDGLVTKSLKLEVGKYQLVEFMLVDSAGVILWATPKEGSPLENLVSDPLPAVFRVTADETTKLNVEVVRVGTYTPADFGYVSFDIEFVNRFCLQLFYSTRCYEEWNDSIMTADGSYAPVYQSHLVVWAGDRIVLNESLNPGLNYYTLPVYDGVYRFMATNCHNDTTYRHRFLIKELLRHSCRNEFNPLVIYDGDTGIYVTPEDLFEPTIGQGVFGQVTVAVNDSSDNGQTGFKAVTRDVYFFPYFEYDSIFYGTGPVDCHFNMDIPVEPVFISRTNSSGFFQAALDPGVYLYMVKEDEGFYIDLYISSRVPGRVEVKENEVTKLYIRIVDCGLWY